MRPASGEVNFYIPFWAYTCFSQEEQFRNDFRTGPYFIMHAEAALSGVMHVQIFLVFEE